MKLLSFHYHLKISFDSPVNHHRFTLRCTPVSDAAQRITQLQHYVFPSDFLSRSRDQWGNAGLYGCCRGTHSVFEANVCGQAVTGLASCIPSGNPTRDAVFQYATPLTRPDAALREFAAGLRLPENDGLQQADAVMHAVHNALRYVSGSTTVQTTAAEAFALGCGVCQDYAQVMLAVLRARGIPARYVTGMLLGEGESHAWVEILHQGNWFAFDPTSDQVVSDQHIKLSHGRDAQDCPINCGVFRGWAGQKTDISVIVTEIS